MMPKKFKVNKRLAVSLDNIKHRIEFDKFMDSGGHHVKVPEDRRCPKTHLQNHTDNLPGITNKNIQGRNNPSDSKRQNAHTDQIVKKLKIIKTERHALK